MSAHRLLCRSRIAILCGALGLVLAASAATTASAAAPAAYVPGEVIVGYRAGLGGDVGAAIDAIGGMRPAQAAPSARVRVLRLPAGERVTTALARLRRQPGVAYAVPNYIAHAAGSFIPNDAGIANVYQGWEKAQWNMLPGAGVDAPRAWFNLRADHRAGGSGVTVAVIDTGVAYRTWRHFMPSPDFSQTRFVSPYDFVDHDRYPLDRLGHGTFVAGVVAESTNNRIGLTGLAYGASIMPVRVLDAQGDGDQVTIARGIRYAVAHGAKVINLSLEFLPSQVYSSSQIPQIVSALDYAHRRGVVVVAAAGNDETDQIAYPARAPGVISVGATTRDRCLANYSNGGDTLSIVAPGGGSDAIVTGDEDCHPERRLPPIYQMTLTDPPNWSRFGFPGDYIGTSMASPLVAATAAMVIASQVLGPHPTPDQVAARLEQTATPLGGSQPNDTYGWGLLNAGQATADLLQGGPVTSPTP
ncbi:MAG: S8 family serine peptidase [Solirubrobacterales bacterium]|nr:S8 family serine peptidase [Solirubrobacterales bacterium]